MRPRLDPVIVTVVLATVAFEAPFLAPARVPLHDTFYNFVNFHVYYSHFFLEHELVQWYPYGSLGIPSALQLVISFTPLEYLTGLVGALLGVRDTLLLFKLSVIGEHTIFAVGTVLVARVLFASRATALALGVAAAGSVVWWSQQWFELRFFYLLPLVLYFALSALRTRRPERMWIAGLTGVAWAMGNVPYFAGPWAVTLLLVLGAPLWAARRDLGRLFSPRPANVLAAIAFVAAAAVFVQVGLHALDGVTQRDEGRDPATGQVPLEVFRSYGGNADLAAAGQAALVGWPVQMPWGSGVDTSGYVGLLILVGFGIALLRERDPVFLGLAAATGLLVAFSLGGIVTTAAYSVPGLSMYRHVGLVYGLVKALVILASGFGLERLWRLRPPRAGARPLAVGAAVALAAAGGLLAFALRRHGDAWAADFVLVFLARAGMLAGGIAASLAVRRSPKLGAIVALALDLALYQAAVRREAPLLAPERAAQLELYEVRPFAYQPTRERLAASAPGEAGRVGLADAPWLPLHSAPTIVYWITHNFTQVDPCWTPYYSDLWVDGVYGLLFLEKRRGLDVSDAIGCGRPKLRLTTDVTLVEGAAAARRAVVASLSERGRDARRRDVIRLESGASEAHAVPAAPAVGSVAVERFTPNELEARVQVESAAGAWLVYADAFDPGWKASIDGAQTPIAEANLAFKAIHVPPGEHRVRFWYRRAEIFAASHAVAGFGLAAGLGLFGIVVLAACGGLATTTASSRDA